MSKLHFFKNAELTAETQAETNGQFFWGNNWRWGYGSCYGTSCATTNYDKTCCEETSCEETIHVEVSYEETKTENTYTCNNWSSWWGSWTSCYQSKGK